MAEKELLACGYECHIAGIVNLLPSGRRGLMLGLTLGSIAGDACAEEVVQMLPRFLLVPRPPLASFLSFKRPAGVLAVMGPIAGLPDIDKGRLDDGVLRGPSLGVFREAERRGVCSWELETCTMVAVGCSLSTPSIASGSSRSSSDACPICPEIPVLAGPFAS